MSQPELPDPLPLPPALRQLADELMMGARETICRGGEAAPEVALLRYAPPACQKLAIDMPESTLERDQLAEQVRLAAHLFKADAVLLLSEVWTLPPDVSLDEAPEFGDISARPDRVERLMVSIETREHKWMGLAPLSGSGLMRRCGDLEFDPEHSACGSEGRFARFLGTPAQAEARRVSLERMEAALRAAGIDPARPVGPPGHSLSMPPLQIVELQMVRNPVETPIPLEKLAPMVDAIRADMAMAAKGG